MRNFRTDRLKILENYSIFPDTSDLCSDRTDFGSVRFVHSIVPSFLPGGRLVYHQPSRPAFLNCRTAAQYRAL